jgi:hypothetical protein
VSDDQYAIYRGNQNLKRANAPVQYTPEQIQEYVKCADDPIYFIKTYVKIIHVDHGLVPFKLWDFQEKMIESIIDNRFSCVLAPRQCGKTSTTAAAMLHYAVFNKDKTLAILANKADQAREILHRIQLMFEYLPHWMKPGVIEWNKGSVEFDSGTRILTSATSGSGIRGRSVSWLALDEYAFVPVNEQEEFFASVYPTISSGKNTKITIMSTPNGMDMFYRIWMDAIEGRSDFKPFSVHWSDVPGRDQKWYEETIRNIGEEKFKQEYNNEFAGATGTLISGAKLKTLRHATPINTWNNVKFYNEPTEKHQYVMTVDCAQGVGGDYSAFSVFDVTEVPYKQVATFYDNNISPLTFPDVIVNTARMYNNAYVLCEVNDIGHKVAYIIQAELEYEYLLTCATKGRNGQCVSSGFGANVFLGVKMTMPVKKVGCSILKKMIETDKLIVQDNHTILELFSFVSNTSGSFAAEKGQHDDSVMTLVSFAWLTMDDFYKELTNQDIRKNVMQGLDLSEDIPYGFFDDGNDVIDLDPNRKTFSEEVFNF